MSDHRLFYIKLYRTKKKFRDAMVTLKNVDKKLRHRYFTEKQALLSEDVGPEHEVESVRGGGKSVVSMKGFGMEELYGGVSVECRSQVSGGYSGFCILERSRSDWAGGHFGINM